MHLPNDYDQICIVCYPPGAGGNFLINCLALADDAVFLDSILARSQLQGNLDQTKKVQYVRDQLKRSRDEKSWNDLKLGNGQLWGISSRDWWDSFPQLLSRRLDLIIGDLIHANKKFFLIHHDLPSLDRLLAIWPRAKVIIFTEYRQFLINRYGDRSKPPPGILRYWAAVRAECWPEMPPSDQEEFDNLPHTIQQELRTQFRFEISRWFTYFREYDQLWESRAQSIWHERPHSVFLWHTLPGYSNENSLLEQLSQLRKQLDFAEVDAEIIKEYFQDWISTLDDIRPAT